MWLACHNNKYYPRVEEFETKEEAEACAESWISPLNTEDSSNEVKIYVCFCVGATITSNWEGL